MSTQIFPSLPGMSIVIKRRPEWRTRISEAWNGQETRLAQRAWPRWRISLQFEVLREADGDLATLQAFFNAHRGAFESFRWLDPDASTVTDQAFATGDGNATLFQLTRQIGTWLEPVWEPNPAGLVVKDNGSLVSPSAYVLGTRGQIQFNAAPAAGRVLTWSGSYWLRARFDKDELEFERFLKGYSKTGSVDLITEVFA